MGNIDVQIIVQLWQIVFAAFLCLATVVGVTFAAAITFVRRSECSDHSRGTNEKFKELFNLVREIKEDVGLLKGRLTK
jgi:hypothetical protein